MPFYILDKISNDSRYECNVVPIDVLSFLITDPSPLLVGVSIHDSP